MPAKTFFEYVCPVKIVSGRKALANLPYELTQLGSKKPMIITDKGVVAAGLIAKVKAAMVEFEGGISVIFDETPVDSSDKVCDKAADIFRKNGCDALVAVGGGSAIDTAKGVNIVVSENTDDLLKYQGVDRINVPLKPLIVIPTTAGTGSEVTNVAVIVNVQAQVKMALMSNKLFPNVAILDPAMTMSLPPKLTAGTGMDALTHSVEAVYSLQGNPVSSALAAAAIKLIKTHLVAAVKDGSDVEARMGMADAALIAGMAFTNAMVGMNHALAHSCGAAAHLPHGVANAILLPYSMEYNIGKAAEKIAGIAPLLSDDNLAGLDAKARAMKAVEGVRNLTSELNKLCGMPIRLSEAGVKEELLDHIAQLAINDGALTYNPEEMDKKDALSVLKKAF